MKLPIDPFTIDPNFQRDIEVNVSQKNQLSQDPNCEFKPALLNLAKNLLKVPHFLTRKMLVYTIFQPNGFGVLGSEWPILRVFYQRKVVDIVFAMGTQELHVQWL